MSPKSTSLLTTLCLLWCLSTPAQKVGVVLSGGGASGMAHIGVLKALENEGVPIDCIAGSSMGAVVAGLYASGVSIETMEAFFEGDRFVESVTGKLDERFTYYFQQYPENAGIISLKIDPDTLLLRTIPAYAVSPVEMDLTLMEVVSEAIAAAGYDFDGLMVPFRCVASDVVKKESVVFRDGELHKALRASASFPFYFKPIEMDGRILFDGGIYNNFPADVLYEEFAPDVIIGSSVSIASPPMRADDLFSQLENMIVNRQKEELPVERGLIIRPETGINTLDFPSSGSAIQIGYEATMSLMDSISGLIDRRRSKEESDMRRSEFNALKKPLLIGNIDIKGVGQRAKSYYSKLMRIDPTNSAGRDIDEVKKLYYRIFGDDKISYVFPTIRYNELSGLYDLTVHLEKEKPLFVDFGGNFSSRPVNTGFIGLKYQLLGKTPKTFYANSYFGKFYNSLLLDARFDFAGRTPFFISGGGSLQQWDYFRSFNTFFQETKPSFILQLEQSVNLSIGLPLSNRSKLIIDGRYGERIDDYYQTDNFAPTDTADVTRFELFTPGVTFERNSLNRKLYASRGTFLSLSGRYVNGIEKTIPGSTGFIEETFRGKREWLQFQVEYENYFKRFGNLGLGVYAKANYSRQPFFSNYRATVLSAPYFQPIPESRTIFQDEFRAYRFGAGGLRLIYTLRPNIELRADNYIFQPLETIREVDFGELEVEEPLLRQFYIGSVATVYHSPIGPLSFSVNYYDQRDEPWSWIINFGYLIFNKRILD